MATAGRRPRRARPGPRQAALAAALLLALAAGPARADEADAAPAAGAALPAGSATAPSPPPDAPPASGWEAGTPRLFLAPLAEIGTTQHLRLVAGWGRPWWTWGGLLADAWLSDAFAIGTLGARLALRGVNLDAHWRVTRYWSRLPLPAAPSHDALATGGGTTTHAWDLDLWGGLPLLGGFLLWEGQATRMLGLSRQVDVFDEVTHGLVHGPWNGLASLGWVADLAGGALQLGAGVDAAFLGRATPRWRAGPQGTWTFSPRWSLRGQLLLPVAGPDHLPLWPSLGGGLVLQWLDATEADRAGAVEHRQ